VLNAGVHTLEATFTPTDAANYLPVSTTVTITVAQATPTISWTSPAAIVYGTALGGTQLDAATAPVVDGTVAYREDTAVVSAGQNERGRARHRGDLYPG
jgi:hypothetical protein